MFGNFLMKTMIKQQIKNLPKDAQDAILKALDENPDFFKNLMAEIQAKVKAGQSQMAATQQVMMAHRAELQKILGGGA
ncbi:MAG: hypothetical protein AAB955_02880 [Patescibacteria group bacterium]